MSKKSLLFVSSLALLTLITACSDDNDGALFDAEQPNYEFAAVDARFQKFLDDSDLFDGISVTLVDQQQGTIHEAAFGDHSVDTVVMLASTSKMPAALLLMALNDDASLNFDVSATIDNYLPWDGVYGDSTTEQLVSNTSGIPGLTSVGKYGTHLCQYVGASDFSGCAQTIYSTDIEGSVAPGTAFSYGGSQWQLAGAVAESVGGASWDQLFAQYIAQPCELEVFRFGNQWSDLDRWTGNPDSLIGVENPNIEGGAISNMRDYAKLLQLLLDGGRCGDTQVVSTESVEFLQRDRGGPLGVPYAMGLWIQAPEDGSAATVFYDPGAFGSISWIDTARGYGGYVAIDDYSRTRAGEPVVLVLNEIISLVEQAIDEARAQ
ncbi:MAG: serine hydrolase domain-containing protein [Pseudomonadales bacterium]